MNHLPKITVKFNKLLYKFTDIKQIELSVYDYTDILSAIKNMFPKLNYFLTTIVKYSKHMELSILVGDKTLKIDEYRMPVSHTKEIYIVPTVYGGDNTISIPQLFGFGRLTSDSLEFEGLERRIRDSALFQQVDTVLDVEGRKNKHGFDSLQLTKGPNNLLALNFGMIRVGGSIINGYVKSLQRGEQDTITVSSFFRE